MILFLLGCAIFIIFVSDLLILHKCLGMIKPAEAIPTKVFFPTGRWTVCACTSADVDVDADTEALLKFH